VGDPTWDNLQRLVRFLTCCGWRSLALLAFVSSVGSSVRAEDAPPTKAGRASLSWQRGPGAEDCISSERLEKALESQLGYAAFGQGGELLVQGAVLREEATAHFRAEVELRDRQGNVLGRREVETRSSACGGLDEALVLVLALAIDTQLAVLSAQTGQVASAPLNEPTPAISEPRSEPSAPTNPQPAMRPVDSVPAGPIPESDPKFQAGVKMVRVRRTGSGFGLVLAVGTGFAVGLMPATAWDASFTLGWRTPSGFGIELTGIFFPFGRVPTSEGRTDYRAGLAELRGCAPVLRAPVLVDACVGLWNGVMRANASGFDLENTSRTSPLSGATTQVRVSWDFYERFFLRTGAGLGVPFVRDRFSVQGSQGTHVVLHRMSPVIALLGLDVGVHFR
jgi:hypothetical protein